jgi:hypothetical protein
LQNNDKRFEKQLKQQKLKKSIYLKGKNSKIFEKTDFLKKKKNKK